MTTNQTEQQKPRSLAAFREQLAGKKGKVYWRSLSELAESEDFEAIIRAEFPRQAGLLDALNRRDFLKVLGASLALAGLAACTPAKSDTILPYVNPPEELVPAKPIYYASTMVQDGYGKGVLVETTFGRPIKVDGLPEHPATMGGSDIFIQASILELYDPDRVKNVTQKGAVKTWKDFTGALGGLVGTGTGLRLLTGMVTSPSLIDQLTALLKQFPGAKWYQYSPVARGNTLAGANQAYGGATGSGATGSGGVEAVYNFTAADVVLSLDSDFMFFEPGNVRYARDFGLRHQPVSANGTMSRLYVVESSATITGANADHRLAVKPSQVETFARALASRLGVAGATAPSGTVPGQDWLDPLVADLQKAGKAALVVAGERQPPAVHVLAHAMNQALGSVGTTVTLSSLPGTGPSDAANSLRGLVDELNGGSVDTLVILEGNPVYTAPADLNFAEAMKKAKNSIYLGYYPDETAEQATWVVPAAHYLEMWGDARAHDGTVSLIQPVIEPLYGGKSAHELLAALAGQVDAAKEAPKGYDLLRTFWQGQVKSGDFESVWREGLSKGRPPVALPAPAGAGAPTFNAAAISAAPAATAGQGLEIVFEPDTTVWDGRFSNNAWLQELPKPLSKLTWDNAAYLSVKTAASLGLKDGDMIQISLRGRSVNAPVAIHPGQPDDVLVVSLGYGRKAGGQVQSGTGFNAYAIRTAEAPWFDKDVQVTKTGGTYPLSFTREHWTMENRDLVREATLADYQANPKFAQLMEEPPVTLYNDTVDNPTQYAWGMSINLNTCIGCNACVIACQAENNIPTVGKDQVANSREMHWLRIDRYYAGSAEKPRRVLFQPVPCMHCEKAPCEPVCPVEATSHSAEGINEMTYNRCVGTRYCSNNCPYKVRRFNFFKYQDFESPSLKAMRNPDVSVRMRGVMEKCSYCVQRVNEARITAEVAGRPIQDGEVKTACQQSCPTNAIVFGNINDQGSQVRKLKDTPLNYGLLEELGTRPRTTYLAKVTNPNPNIKEQG